MFVVSIAVDVMIGDGDLVVDPLCRICAGEWGDLNSTHGECKDFVSVRGIVDMMFGLFGNDATDEATVLTVVDIVGAALLTLITGAGTHDALIEIDDVTGMFGVNDCGPCAGNVGMIFPVARIFCCSMNNRCSA